jgi:hypothetical protein
VLVVVVLGVLVVGVLVLVVLVLGELLPPHPLAPTASAVTASSAGMTADRRLRLIAGWRILAVALGPDLALPGARRRAKLGYRRRSMRASLSRLP